MRISNLLWGLFFVILGVILGLNALDITNINIFFDGWWTLFIIIPCFIDLFKDEDKTGNTIGLVIGILLLLASNNLIDFDLIFKLMVPFILVMIGLSFIFKDTIKTKVKKEIKKIGKKNDKEYCATFGGINVNLKEEEFDGCNLTAVFGGVKCDLKDAIIKEDVVINVSAIFGGVTIYVPDNADVKINSTPIFGGVTDERKTKVKDNKVTIYINATCMFGGCEIK